jgi:hypothetical protein
MQVTLRPAGGLRLVLATRAAAHAHAAPAASARRSHACPFHG